MALFKATDKGQVQMSAQEEAEILAQWAAWDNTTKTKDTPKPKTLEDRVAALEEIALNMDKK